MAKYVIEDTTLTGIADAIRGKTGTTDPIAVTDMAAQIEAITGGGSEETLTAIFEEQTVEGFADGGYGAASVMVDTTSALVVGETYKVLWDEAEVTLVAEDLDGIPALLHEEGGFSVQYLSPELMVEVMGTESGALMFVSMNTEATSHTVGIYQVAGGGAGDDSAEGIVYVTFMDGDTELCKTACIKGDSTVDPVVDGKIATPTRQLADGTALTFFGWSHSDEGEVDELALTDVAEDTTLYASFIIAKGTSDSGVSWRIYSTGLMVVDGEGATADYAVDVSMAQDYKQYVTRVVVKEGVTAIGENAFFEYPNLCSVTLPESVTAIKSYAFMGCSALQSVNIPTGVTAIKSQAFQNCSALEYITIPAAVTQIQFWAFMNAGLTSAVFENPNGWSTVPGLFVGVTATLSAEDLSDPATAASYLTDGDYSESTWNRS